MRLTVVLVPGRVILNSARSWGSQVNHLYQFTGSMCLIVISVRSVTEAAGTQYSACHTIQPKMRFCSVQ